MLQHLRPALVNDDRPADARGGGAREVEPEMIGRHDARTFYDTTEHAPDGVLGDQTEATPAKGEQLFESAVEELVRLCDWMADRERAELVPRPHV